MNGILPRSALVVALFALAAAGAASVTVAGPPAFVAEIFVDFGADSHAGPGPHPTTEADTFRLAQGGVRWAAGGTVKYRILPTAFEPAPGADVAIEAAFASLDTLNTNRTFAHDDFTAQINPCTGTANKVHWLVLDGPGGALAAASVCKSVSSKVIVGFDVFVDVSEPWDVVANATAFDVENVVVHEAGHANGLGHVNGPANGCLTMYSFAGLNETQKRTPGLGDKLGMHELYGQPDTSAGPGCGN